MKMTILTLLVIFTSCSKEDIAAYEKKHNEEELIKKEMSKKSSDMLCVGTGDMFYRCENDEVVCYKFAAGRRGGVSCKFKK
jgi:hypothetical protein